MIALKCKMCGGNLNITQEMSVGTCQYCGSQQTLPKINDDKRTDLYERANNFRRNNEYDKASALYEYILNEDRTDAEAYWSLVLCKYGVEYVEDPYSHKRIPTCNRTQFMSILSDEDYKQALIYADEYAKSIYEVEAAAIDALQKDILSVSNKEEPFDIFICYKEADNFGRRTRDSVLAQDLYGHLKSEGFKVFFARITLEDKIGSAYEPYIFAALQSAKVMIVLCTNAEHLNAVWVKNEWSRYLALIRSGAKKTLIPVISNMEPYNLPNEFLHLQAQDLGKVGGIQDLIRGIHKICNSTPSTTQAVGISSTNAVIRGMNFLEDGNALKAQEYFERALDTDPQCSSAYLGNLLIKFFKKNVDELKEITYDISEISEFKRALACANSKEREVLEEIQASTLHQLQIFRLVSVIKKVAEQKKELIDKQEKMEQRLRNAYQNGCASMRVGAYDKASKYFDEAGGYLDATEKLQECNRMIKERAEISQRQIRESKDLQLRSLQWQQQGLCGYCGGKLSFFKRKCKSCGRTN